VRTRLIAMLILATGTSAGAQIGRSRFGFTQPAAWVSAGVGLDQGFTVIDGKTNSRWEFGSATQYHVTMEKSVSPGATLGVHGSTGRVPLLFNGITATEADANVSRIFATARLSSGVGFHSVLEASAGATIYSNFQRRDTGAQIGPSGATTDFSFAFGYGLGYAFSPTFAVDVVQDITTDLHSSSGVPPNTDSSVRIHGTRIMGRIGW